MKADNLGALLLALGAAGIAYYIMKEGFPKFAEPRADNLLPSPGAFTEYTPVFASELPPEQRTPAIMDLWT